MKDPQSDARIRDLEQRMAAMPGSRIFVGLAEEYRRAGRFADALAILRNGLEAHPTYLSARIAIARLFQETGRVDEAVEAFSKVLASDRENLVAAKALGDLYGRRGNAVEAVKKFKLYRALSGDRSVDERIVALEREAKAEGVAPPPAAAPAPPPPAPAGPPASAPASRLFDPMNYADTSGAFELGPNATLALSTLDFAAAEEPEIAIETTSLPPSVSASSSEASASVPSEEPPAPASAEVPDDATVEGSATAGTGLQAMDESSPRASTAPDEIPASGEVSAAGLPAAGDLPAAMIGAPEESDALPVTDEERHPEPLPPGEEISAAVAPAPADDARAASELPEAEEVAAADELPDENEGESSAMPDLPPSRTLAELYERQGFPEEARHIYDRLDASPEAGSASRHDPFAPPAEAPAGEAQDPRARKRRAIESWLSRVKTNASAGAR